MNKLKLKFHLWMIRQLIKLDVWVVVYKEKYKRLYLQVETQVLEEEARKIKPDTRFKNKITYKSTNTCLRKQYDNLCKGKPVNVASCIPSNEYVNITK